MWIENKYHKFYFQIINRSKDRVRNPNVYYERHHIIPKSLSGSLSVDNLVYLTAREHFICHRLLVKFTEGEYKRKMSFALSRFFQNNPHQQRVLTSYQYESIRKIMANSIKGKNNPMHTHSIDFSGKKNPFYGKTHTEEVRKIISEKNEKWCREHGNSFLGKSHSIETKEKLSKIRSKPIRVYFMDGNVVDFPNKISLGPHLGKSIPLGVKLCKLKHSNLLKQYNIKKVKEL
jgi:hypothetical protein